MSTQPEARIAELEAERDAALAREAALAEVLAAINRNPSNPTPVFETILAKAHALLGASIGTLWTYDGEYLHGVATHGHPDDVAAYIRREPVPPTGDVMRLIEGEPFAQIPDLRAAGPMAPGIMSMLVERTEVRTVLIVPLRKDGGFVGQITAFRTEVRPFVDREIALLENFAAQAVIAMENARLLTEQRESLARQTATAEILEVINRNPGNLTPVFETILAKAHQLCGAEIGSLGVYENGMFRKVARHGYQGEADVILSRPYAPSENHAPLFRGEPIHIPDTATHPWPDPEHSHAFFGSSGLRAWLEVPLWKDGALLGSVSGFRRVPGAFSDQEIRLLEGFAAQAVIAMENARLLDELRERTAELAERNDAFSERIDHQAATIDVLKEMAASPDDPQPVFDLIVRQAQALCGSRNAALFEYDGTMLHYRAWIYADGWTDAHEDYRRQFPRVMTRYPNLAVNSAILEGRIVHIRDADREPGVAPAARASGIRAGVVVPIFRDGAAVGAITMTNHEPGGFSDTQIELLQTFAEQAAIAMGSAETYRALQARTADLQESLEYQTATSDVLKVISRSAFDVVPILSTMAETAARLCGAKQATVMRYEDGELQLVANFGFPPEYAAALAAMGKFPLDRGTPSVGHRCLAECAPVHVRDIAAVPGYPDEAIRLGKQRTSLGVPLVRDGEPIGCIVLARQRVEPFTERQIDLVSTFADQAVIAIENTRLLTEQREALEQQTATAEVLEAINRSSGDLTPVFDIILEKAHALCGVTMGALLVVDDDGMHRAVATRGYSRETDEHARQPRPLFQETLEGLTRGRRIVHLPDMGADETMMNSPFARRFIELSGARTYLMIPLRKDDAILGMISAVRTEVKPFSEKEIALLENFAAQAVIAMENARLLEELRASTTELAERNAAFAERIDHQAATIDVLKEMSASPGDAQPVFELICHQARALLGTETVGLFEYDGTLVHYRTTTSLDAMAGTDAAATYSRSWPRVPDRGSLTCRAILDGEIVHIRDIAAEPNISEMVRALRHKSQVSVPLIRDGRAIGAISTGSTRVDGISDTQVELLKTFAEQAVIAISSAETYRALRQSLEHQGATIDVLKVISTSTGDTQPVFDTILNQAMKLCGCSFGGLVEFDGELVHRRAMIGFEEARLAAYLRTLPPAAPPTRASGTGRAILDRKVDYVRDSLADPDIPAAVRGLGHRSGVAVPLMRGDAVIGAIGIAHKDVDAFSTAQIELLKTFAEQAVIAIGGAETFRALQERTAALAHRNSEFGERIEQQAATIDVLKVMSSTPDDTQPVFDQIVRRAKELCNGNTSALFQYDGALVHFRAMYSDVDFQSPAFVSYLAQYPMAPTSGSVPCRAILDGQSIHITDVLAEPGLTPAVRALVADGNYRSQIVIPLMRDGQGIGCISLTAVEPGGFADSQIALLQTFAEQAVIAITSVANFRALRERTAELTRSVAELQALEEVLRAVNSSLDLDTVLSTIISRAVRLSEADEGTIYEFDDAEDAFILKSTYGMAEDRIATLRDSRIKLGETHLGRAGQARAPVHVPDVQADPTLSESAKAALAGIHAVLAVPLLRDDKVVGGLVIRRRTVGQFPPSIPTLLQTFAGQSVLAIENARLFQELAARGEEARRARIAAESALADLRRTQDRLLQTEKLASLGQLTAGIAHEIKNPLNFVNNFSDLSVDLLAELNEAVAPERLTVADDLRAEIDEITGTLKTNLEKIAHHGRRADSIVKNMLLHSRTGASEHRMMDLNGTVEEALNLAYHGERAKTQGFNITMQTDFDPKAGAIDAFPQEISRVLLNLIGNGFYAAHKRAARTEDKGFEPTLKVTTRDLGDQVEIRVRDNGTGIPEIEREKIFEPFFTTKPAGEGTGLGLSLSFDIVVKQHGGSMAVDSQTDSFTEFTVTLPRRIAEGAAP